MPEGIEHRKETYALPLPETGDATSGVRFIAAYEALADDLSSSATPENEAARKKLDKIEDHLPADGNFTAEQIRQIGDILSELRGEAVDTQVDEPATPLDLTPYRVEASGKERTNRLLHSSTARRYLDTLSVESLQTEKGAWHAMRAMTLLRSDVQRISMLVPPRLRAHFDQKLVLPFTMQYQKLTHGIHELLGKEEHEDVPKRTGGKKRVRTVVADLAEQKRRKEEQLRNTSELEKQLRNLVRGGKLLKDYHSRIIRFAEENKLLTETGEYNRSMNQPQTPRFRPSVETDAAERVRKETERQFDEVRNSGDITLNVSGNHNMIGAVGHEHTGGTNMTYDTSPERAAASGPVATPEATPAPTPTVESGEVGEEDETGAEVVEAEDVETVAAAEESEEGAEGVEADLAEEKARIKEVVTTAMEEFEANEIPPWFDDAQREQVITTMRSRVAPHLETVDSATTKAAIEQAVAEMLAAVVAAQEALKVHGERIEAARARGDLTYKDDVLGDFFEFGPAVSRLFVVNKALKTKTGAEAETDYEKARVEFIAAKAEFTKLEKGYIDEDGNLVPPIFGEQNTQRLKQINQELENASVLNPVKKRKLNKEKALFEDQEQAYKDAEETYMAALHKVLEERKLRHEKRADAEGLSEAEKAARPKYKEEGRGFVHYKAIIGAHAFAVTGDTGHRANIEGRDRRSTYEKRLDFRKETLPEAKKHAFEVVGETWERWKAQNRFLAGAMLAGAVGAGVAWRFYRGASLTQIVTQITASALVGGVTRLGLDKLADKWVAGKFKKRIDNQIGKYDLTRTDAISAFDAEAFAELRDSIEYEFEHIEEVKDSNDTIGKWYTRAKTAAAIVAGGAAGYGVGQAFSSPNVIPTGTPTLPGAGTPGGVPSGAPGAGTPAGSPGAGVTGAPGSAPGGAMPSGAPSSVDVIAPPDAGVCPPGSPGGVPTGAESIVPEPRPEIITIDKGDSLWRIMQGRTDMPTPSAFEHVPADKHDALRVYVEHALQKDPTMVDYLNMKTEGNMDRLWLFTGDRFNWGGFNDFVSKVAVERGLLDPSDVDLSVVDLKAPDVDLSEPLAPHPPEAIDGIPPELAPVDGPGVEAETPTADRVTPEPRPDVATPGADGRPAERPWSDFERPGDPLTEGSPVPPERASGLVDTPSERRALLESSLVLNSTPERRLDALAIAGLGNVDAGLSVDDQLVLRAESGQTITGIAGIDSSLQDSYKITEVLYKGGELDRIVLQNGEVMKPLNDLLIPEAVYEKLNEDYASEFYEKAKDIFEAQGRNPVAEREAVIMLQQLMLEREHISELLTGPNSALPFSTFYDQPLFALRNLISAGTLDSILPPGYTAGATYIDFIEKLNDVGLLRGNGTLGDAMLAAAQNNYVAVKDPLLGFGGGREITIKGPSGLAGVTRSLGV